MNFSMEGHDKQQQINPSKLEHFIHYPLLLINLGSSSLYVCHPLHKLITLFITCLFPSHHLATPLVQLLLTMLEQRYFRHVQRNLERVAHLDQTQADQKKDASWHRGPQEICCFCMF